MIIYKTTNLINNKIYIGQDSKNNPKYLGSGLILKKAIKKYGEKNFKKEILEHCINQDELNEREKYWIKELNSIVPNGYNITDGGTGGNTILNYTNEQLFNHKIKLSNAIKNSIKHQLSYKSNERNNKISKKRKLWFSTHSFSKITRNKLRKININKLFAKYNLNDELCKKVINYHIKDKLHLKKISELYNISYTAINRIFEKYNVNTIRYLNAGNYKAQFKISDDIKSEIISLYTKENYMQIELQKKFNIPESIIKKILIENNVIIRSNKFKHSDRMKQHRESFKTPPHIIQEIIKLRTIDKLNIVQICDKLNLGYTIIKRVLTANGYSTKKNDYGRTII
jgi:group I intron endonuclease